MAYSEEMLESIRKVEANRAHNAALEPTRLTAEEKEAVLSEYHPDHIESQFAPLVIGPNKGEKAPLELVELLQGKSRINAAEIDLMKPDFTSDVLIIGGGGAGTSAAIEADNAGASVLLVTKLRVGDANSMMAEGGIQAADKKNDSPAQHFLDAFGGGHFAAKKELLERLVTAKIILVRRLCALCAMKCSTAIRRLKSWISRRHSTSSKTARARLAARC